jgi:ribosomal protein L40E
MWTQVKGRLAALRTHLTHAGERQPLGKAALVIVLFLDVFVLVAIFGGLEEHTRQLASPEDRVPYLCRAAVLERGWTAAGRLDRLGEAASACRGVYGGPAARSPAVHPVCAPVLAAVDAACRDDGVTGALDRRGALACELTDARTALASTKGAYDTALLRTVAGRPGAPSGVAAIEQDVLARTAALEALSVQRAEVEAELERARPVAAVWASLDAVTDADRERLRSELARLTFWFPVKKLGMQLVFLLPLLGAFFAWSAASIRRRRGLQAVIASHLLVVAAIPVFLQLVEAVYDVLPKRLLAAVIRLLTSLQLVAIFHYAVIAAAIAAALLLVAFVQRRLFSREKLLEKRIAKGLCQDCGRRLPAGARACPFCGFDQFRGCPGCGGVMQVHAPFCQGCGKAAA